EHIQATPVVQAFGLHAHAGNEMQRWNSRRIRTEMAADMRAYPYWGLVSAIEVVVVMLVLYVGSKQLFGQAMGIGTLVLFIEYARRLFEPILAFSEQLGFVQKAFASADRVFEVLETPSRTPDRPGASTETPRDFERVAFEKVSFSYDDGPPALRNVSFEIRRGEHVALVGRSGGGKSTIAKLLMRFYEPSEGRISVDGTDLRELTHEAWRRAVGFVPQDIHLFPGTIRDNLTVLDETISEERLQRVLEVVQAKDLIARREKGLDSSIGEGGQSLSQGERQLLCFARAIVRDPPLLILDEATSSVDPGTERRLQEAILRLLAGRTALTIAHRLSTVLSADRILVVSDGRIVAEGKHEELVRKSDLYRELCRLQLREEPAEEKTA
ncbi:MAG: ABC transporter ATP-binding protein, partial [Myxococcota bacterium]